MCVKFLTKYAPFISSVRVVWPVAGFKLDNLKVKDWGAVKAGEEKKQETPFTKVGMGKTQKDPAQAPPR